MIQRRKFSVNEIVEPNLADQVARFSWFHSINLGNGVVTPGAKRLPHLQQEANAILGPCYLNGRSVLDVGAWDGYFSFEAKRRGAEYVLATDKYAWSEWPYGIGAFELARRHLGLDVDCRVIEVADIDPSLRSFDVVLFLGVFYHLFDPLTALGRVASVTKDVLVVETHQEGVGFPAPIMTMFPSIELNRDPTN
jgi:tRNA (mo5U34)-methyltransferase